MSTVADPLGIVGTLVDEKYRVENAIAAGGAAVVYRAYNVLWNLDVALKVLVSAADVPPEEKKRLLDAFVREGQIMSALSTRSPVIVTPRDMGSVTASNGATVPYLVLEWLDGEPLDVVLTDETRRGMAPRTIDEAFDLLAPVAMALEVAHKEGIVHRDVKPENIFILGDARSSERRMKLIDFGISKVMASVGSVAQTGYAVTPFTPQYGAPEQFSRAFGATGPWTDVFALALVLLETMRGGRRAFSGDDYVELARQSRNEAQRPTPHAYGLVVSNEVELVMARAVATQPEARYATAGDFWSALEIALRPSQARTLVRSSAPPRSAEAPSSARPVEASPKPRRGAAAWGALLGATLAFVSVVLVGWHLVVRSRVDAPRASPNGTTTAPPLASASGSPVVAVAAPALCPPGALPVVGGRYVRGDASDQDAPRRTVFVDTFCIDTTEVTADAYAACVASKKCAPPDKANATLCNLGARGDHPMNCVTHAEATSFCATRDMRLPSEAEWELAARGPKGLRFPWGDESQPGWANLCNGGCASTSEPDARAPTDGFAATAPIGAFPRDVTSGNVVGLGGNVSEWCADFFAPYPPDGAVEVNPHGPKDGEKRVVRGASFATKEDAAGAFRRRSQLPDERSPLVGFRCASALRSGQAP